ncbi:ZIP family metal transporter [Alicyclobacillus shizuokensis]|uniref:ZIP family metal transporter n=1 Tax=Alicyclobacillus shizuokensis TaxID=392014 RepID=UPI00147001BB|nr:ZIP family metal transporter [Alicyclobacillus shizuokensis]MCL6625414.1 ZIP family metal transporter [Alicyclobacillus shizuokensis]
MGNHRTAAAAAAPASTALAKVMAMPLWTALAAAGVCALAILAGGAWVLGQERRLADMDSRRILTVFGFGAGVFCALVVVDFLPDAVQSEAAGIPYAVLTGTVFLWALTHLIDRRFDAAQPYQDPTRAASDVPTPRVLNQASSIVIMVSLALHSLLEGGAMAASVTAGENQDWVFLLGMVIHKLPEGVLWALALVSGFPSLLGQRRRVVSMLCVPGIAGIIGSSVGIEVLPHIMASLQWVMAVLAGCLLYIAFSELLPTLRGNASRAVLVPFLFGILVICLLTMWVD